MGNITPQLYTLLVFMVIGSIVAIETRNLLSAVISVSAVGFALSIAFLFLGAPDIAITQLVVEVLVLIILIRGTILLDNTAIEKGRDTLAMVVNYFGLFDAEMDRLAGRFGDRLVVDDTQAFFHGAVKETRPCCCRWPTGSAPHYQ